MFEENLLQDDFFFMILGDKFIIRIQLLCKLMYRCINFFMGREVWPEDNYFGKPGLNSNDELDILKQIFYANLGPPTGMKLFNSNCKFLLNHFSMILLSFLFSI